MLLERSVQLVASALPASTAELATQDLLERLAMLGHLAPSDKRARRVSSAPSALLVSWVLQAELDPLERKARLASPVSLERLVLLESLAVMVAWGRLA